MHFAYYSGFQKKDCLTDSTLGSTDAEGRDSCRGQCLKPKQLHPISQGHIPRGQALLCDVAK